MVRHGGATTSVMLIEDLHWLDEASEDFITTLMDAVADTQAMVVVNYRPGYTAAWISLPHFRELALSELSGDETHALVGNLVGPRPELREIRERIVDRSAGNPFFAEELVHSLAESGEIFGEAGDYRRGTHFGDTPLPATVEAVVSARIDRLGESEKSLLQSAAIIGKEFPLQVLHEVAGQPHGQVTAALARLCEAELIQEQSTIEHRQFSFRHPLIQDVAYSSQLKARRGLLHAAVAEAMEAFYSDRENEFAGLLAYHYEAAGRPADAAHYSARAAMWVGSTNPAQAIKHWEKVRLLLQDQSRSPAMDSQRIMANAQIAWLGWREGRTAEALDDVIREGLELARETDDSMVPMLLLSDGRSVLASGGSADVYVKRVEEALSLVRPDNLGRAATLNCALSQAYGWAGLLNQALTASDAAIERLRHVDKFDHEFLGYSVEHWVLTLRARILVQLGRFAEAEECIRNLLKNQNELGDPTVQFIPHLAYVELAWCRNDLAMAQQHAAAVSEIANESTIPYLQLYAFACRGTAEHLAGNIGGAAKEFTAAVGFMRETRASLELEPQVLASLSECQLALGDPGLALATAEEAIDLARRRRLRLAECRAVISRGAALLAQRDATMIEDAQHSFREAEDLIRVTGAAIYKPLLARARANVTAVVS
jgi:tetratricopeptide (TPR) repeat protein